MKKNVLFFVLVITIVGFLVYSCKDERKSPDYTGSWEKGEFVDEFKTKTGEIYYTKSIYGAKTGSINSEYKDNVDLTCIATKNSISFEIGGSLTTQTYKMLTVKIQDKDSNRYEANISMNPKSRRFIFDGQNGAFLANKFIEGGPIKFIVSPLSPASSGLTFEMDNSDLAYFENAYKKLTQ